MKKKGFKAQNPNDAMAHRAEEESKENVVTKVAEPKTEATTEEQPKRKAGRPRKSESEKKRQYTITFDPKLYEQLQSIAEESFKSTSQLITDACVEYIKNNR